MNLRYARAVFALCLLGAAVGIDVRAGAAVPDLDQTEALRRVDHPRFERQLAALHHDAAGLSPAQRWHLQYLDAWEALYHGHDDKAGALFRQVIADSHDQALAAKASALLLSQLGIERHYTQMFELANRLVTELPQLTHRDARYLVLLNLSQAVGQAAQTEVAVRYARMAEASIPPGESRCLPMSMQVTARFVGNRVAVDDPQLHAALALCSAAHETVIANTLELVRVDLEAQAGQVQTALDGLDRITPQIDASGYFDHKQDALALRAELLQRLGDRAAAAKAAQAAVAMSTAGDINSHLERAYHVLYEVAASAGNSAAALAAYKQYAAQRNARQQDSNARALAYEAVQQQVLAERQRVQQLAQQNALLVARQTLEAKRVETNRLYVLLLSMVVALGALWMFRLKRSQLRFRRLSRLDGLTGILNRQHFVVEAERALRELQRQRAVACMVFIDLDYFKRINDTYGHSAGDEVLRHVVETGRQQLRAGDLFGRLGGEEFGMLLLGCTHEQGFAIADRVRRAIEATPVVCDETTVAVSASLGLAFTDTCGYVLRHLFREADLALYKAKRGGRNRTMVAAPTGELAHA